jgi:DNA-binding CsgD family transcriptional regulator
MERSRTKERKSGRRALDLWHPLVGARWTLVDGFEENGSRYIIARENQAHAPHFEMLAARERQVVLQAVLGFSNKEIAYSLGISDSTVRVLMARATRKLGVRSRKELTSLPSLSQLRGEGAAAEGSSGEPPRGSRH